MTGKATDPPCDQPGPQHAFAHATTDEDLLLALSAIRRVMSLRGEHCPSLVTLHRWIAVGVSGVKLRTSMIGGRRMTCLAWLKDFNREIGRIREERRKFN